MRAPIIEELEVPGKLIVRFAIERGIFAGEASLFELAKSDEYVKHSSKKKYVELSDVFIDKGARSDGWGNMLINVALAYAQRNGWCIFLRAIPYDNSPLSVTELMGFYRKHGFKSTKHDEREMIWRPRRKSTKAI
jgi:GNAT superfamily N-acetyltransferase